MSETLSNNAYCITCKSSGQLYKMAYYFGEKTRATPFGGTEKKVKGKIITKSFPQKIRHYTAKAARLFFPIIALHTVVEKLGKATTSNHFSRGQACGNKCKVS